MVAFGRIMSTWVLAPVSPAVSGWGLLLGIGSTRCQGYAMGPGAVLVQKVAPQTNMTSLPARPLPAFLGTSHAVTVVFVRRGAPCHPFRSVNHIRNNIVYKEIQDHGQDIVN
jgi:hypothetical protein